MKNCPQPGNPFRGSESLDGVANGVMVFKPGAGTSVHRLDLSHLQHN